MDATKRCPYCAEEILAAAKKCKHCGSDLQPEVKESNKTLKSLGAILSGTVLVLWLVNTYSTSNGVTSSPAAPEPLTPVSDSPGVPPAPRFHLPKLEQVFIETVADAQARSHAAQNDMQRGGIKARRDRRICSILRSRNVTNWIGTVQKIDSNSDGKGVLEIEIADNVAVKTWNNELSDIQDQTLIEPETVLFTQAAAMKPGQTISFSGSFVSDSDVPCVKESSLTLKGNVEEPEFVFKFSAVSDQLLPKTATAASPVPEDLETTVTESAPAEAQSAPARFPMSDPHPGAEPTQ